MERIYHLKKALTITCLLILATTSQPGYGQNEKNYTLHFQKSDFVYSFDKDSLLIIRASQQPCLFSEDTLAPAMPYININILIGRNQEMEDFDVSFDDNIAFAGVDMAPNSTITPTRHEYSMRSNAHIQFEKAAYPEERIHFTKTQLMDGYKILSFCVSPFTYSVPTRTLSLSDSICIHIKVNESRIGIERQGAATMDLLRKETA